MTDPAADTTANDDTSSEQVVETAIPETEELELSPEQQAEAEAKAKEQEQAKESRTQKRRRQRQKREVRESNEARHKAEVDAAYWKGKAEAGSSSEPDEAVEPQQDDYETFGEYNKALIKWELAQASDKDKPPADKRQAKPNKPVTDNAGTESEELTTFRAAGAEKYGEEEFSEMMEAASNQEFPSSQTMVDVMLSEENGIDMAMHFYDNPDDAARIAKLSPLKQLNELNKLGETLGTTKKTPSKNISSAPPPHDAEKGSSAKSVDLENASMEEYVRIREKQLAR